MALRNSLVTQSTETKKINNLKEMDWKLRSSKICLIGIMKEEKRIAEK